MAVRYLLDSRLFRQLCAPGQEAPLAGFRASVARLGLAPEGGLPPLELTHMGLLEALGVEPPQLEIFPLPAAVIKSGEALQATTLVVKFIEGRFREVPELRPEALRKRAEELRQATEPAAHDLFDLCFHRILTAEDFVDPIMIHLAFDYLYRYPFPEGLRDEVFHFLCASLFASGETVAGLSIMRMMKVLWDKAYPRLLRGNPAARGEIQAVDREMKPRTRKDFLDLELIHHTVLGLATKKHFHPVTAFTPDPAEKIKARCIAYKSALRAFLDDIDHDDLVTVRYKLDAWRPGTLVPCREDGTCETPVVTGDLPVYVGRKPGSAGAAGAAVSE
jgi:hypothetical protein